MKTNKLISTLCAVSMILSALPFASAAEPVSEYAGETVPVHVTYYDAAGNVSEATTTVDIPENATQSEASMLLNQAAGSAVLPTTRAARKQDMIVGWGKARFGTSYATHGTVFLERNYSRLYFEFYNATYTGNPTRVYVKLIDGASDGLICSAPLRDDGVNTNNEPVKTAEVIIVDGTSYGDVTAQFNNGDAFDLACRVNAGTITCGGLIVYGEY